MNSSKATVNLNTYHVKVQWLYYTRIEEKSYDLNTYHVKVQSKEDIDNNLDVAFKYIPC